MLERYIYILYMYQYRERYKDCKKDKYMDMFISYNFAIWIIEEIRFFFRFLPYSWHFYWPFSRKWQTRQFECFDVFIFDFSTYLSRNKYCFHSFKRVKNVKTKTFEYMLKKRNNIFQNSLKFFLYNEFFFCSPSFEARSLAINFFVIFKIRKKW